MKAKADAIEANAEKRSRNQPLDFLRSENSLPTEVIRTHHRLRAQTSNPLPIMLPKYKVTYDIDQHGKLPASHFTTDDPVTCETFLTDLLDRKLHIREIAHEGVALPPKQFDEMVRSAVLQLASRHVCTSLKISTDEAHVRFGLPA